MIMLRVGLWVSLLLSLLLSGCSQPESAVVVEGNFPIVYVQRQNSTMGSPVDGIRWAAGGDLFWRDLASPSVEPINLTGGYTQGQGDVSDPEVSYDASKIIFSMKGPNDASWNLWQYQIATKKLSRVIGDDLLAAAGNDVDPAYLPDGRIVFSSDRQSKSRQLMQAEGMEPFATRDEYEREASIVLHTMNADGSSIEQISFNQSHDRNPTVLKSGELLYSRWDHVGSKNHFPLFFSNPDGTNLFVLYGAFSPGNSYLHPREMQDGRIITSVMPLLGTHEGGALLIIDKDNFTDIDQAAFDGVTGSGQQQATLFELPLGREISQKGRYTTPYPLWDGSNRVLLSWSPYQPVNKVNPFSGVSEVVEGLPRYGIYMFDLQTKTQRPIALAPEGWVLTDAIAVMPRQRPFVVPDKPLNAALVAEGKAILNVKSVYDTDQVDLMGESVLLATESLPMLNGKPDLARLKDPLQTSAAQRPARFLRVSRALPTPPGISREFIGESRFEMQQILGYAPIEPDGSFKLKVPADTPLALSVVDASGRALQMHTNWVQARPGETRTCNGCHSPRRGSALNTAPISGNHPNTLLLAENGESMAETRTRLDATALDLAANPHFVDVWTDPAVRLSDAELLLDYSGLSTPAPQNGMINYAEHIQPLWSVSRGGGVQTCVRCHNGTDFTASLDLSDAFGASGRLTSYESLLIGKPQLDSAGLPIVQVNDGEVTLLRQAPLVNVGNSRGTSRSSALLEKLNEQELLATAPLQPFTLDHRPMLNSSEKRLIAEWIDLGAQYRNDPYGADANGNGQRDLAELSQAAVGLDEKVFEQEVQPILMARCSSCHQPFGSSSGVPDLSAANSNFVGRNFVLTGNLLGDFNVTVAMISDICIPANSALLARAVNIETDRPPHLSVNGAAVLSPTELDYLTISAWISAAGAANGCP